MSHPNSRDAVRWRRLEQIAQTTLRAEATPSSQGLTIVITGDRAIRLLNRRFLQVDAPTDVLAFSSDEAGYLGDIVISYETASRNAQAFNWRVGDELSLLVVHGVLHLLGYDDSTHRAHKKMWKRQEDILGKPVVNDVLLSRRRDHTRSRSA